MIIEGNYLLLEESPWDQVAGLLTACVYLDLDNETRIERLVERHIEFGKASDHAHEFVMRSDEANARIVSGTRSRADLVVRMS